MSGTNYLNLNKLNPTSQTTLTAKVTRVNGMLDDFERAFSSKLIYTVLDSAVPANDLDGQSGRPDALRFWVIELDGLAMTAARAVQVPDRDRLYFVRRTDVGLQSITFRPIGGTGVSIASLDNAWHIYYVRSVASNLVAVL